MLYLENNYKYLRQIQNNIKLLYINYNEYPNGRYCLTTDSKSKTEDKTVKNKLYWQRSP